MEEKLDLTKSFFRTKKENGWLIAEYNLPNDQLGDFETEWWDKEQWDKWNAYIKDLEDRGIRGDLVYGKFYMQENPAFDNSTIEPKNASLDSYSLKIIDLNDGGETRPDSRD